jgi:hypothetical protein
MYRIRNVNTGKYLKGSLISEQCSKPYFSISEVGDFIVCFDHKWQALQFLHDRTIGGMVLKQVINADDYFVEYLI